MHASELAKLPSMRFFQFPLSEDKITSNSNKQKTLMVLFIYTVLMFRSFLFLFFFLDSCLRLHLYTKKKQLHRTQHPQQKILTQKTYSNTILLRMNKKFIKQDRPVNTLNSYVWYLFCFLSINNLCVNLCLKFYVVA